MSIKGALNFTATLMSVITGLGSFATWTLYNSYTMAVNEFATMRTYRQEMSIRVERLEAENRIHWEMVETGLKDLNKKIDSVFELRVRPK